MLLFAPAGICAREFHVSTKGNDAAAGTRPAPLRTIQRASELAQPGDVITVHEGLYRERINPPRGGTSEKRRIVYQAARGAKVEIKGSELIRDWVKVQDNVWKVTLPNSFFGNFNPYTNEIRGDWFNPKGRKHHTGAVYLNGEWLVEAAELDEVLAPGGTPPKWMSPSDGSYLLNLAWLRPRHEGAARTSAEKFAAQEGVKATSSSEGGMCIGWIEHGDWVCYEKMDMGQGTRQMEFRASSSSAGGIIEIRLDSRNGELLGTCAVQNTAGWQVWSTFTADIKPVSGVKTICLVFKAHRPVIERAEWMKEGLWFARVEGGNTTIWAQFKGVDPNKEQVEINVRQSVFYPEETGRDFITVRGFTMRHAATPWAPPTAEQIGLIGTHWSKGWIIENNIISHSVCSGVALGKHGDEFDNTSANTAEGYVKTIERGLARGWSRENIGHHVVRNNRISHCEQTGIVGSLGAAFSTVTGNTIHDIHVRRLFGGAEMAGIKFHGAIDTVIERNHIFNARLGLWLDWMTQGTRVSRNIFHDNDRDLFVEVNHGPFMVDNNLFLSPTSLQDMSQGGAYAHNLFAGKVISSPESRRQTPYHPPHTTEVAGYANTKGGDSRFYNNIFLGAGDPSAKDAASFGLAVYNPREYPLYTGGNVFYKGAQPYGKEIDPVVSSIDPGVKLTRQGNKLVLLFNPGPDLGKARTQIVTTELLGLAKVPGLPFENPDGSALKINTDFFGNSRNKSNPVAGPFEDPGGERITLKIR
jgi:alpha-L-arabinofuranosidase